jgi:hypothetical protein
VIDRCTFLACTGAVLLASPLVAEAQVAGTYRIAYVNSASETQERRPHVQARRAIRELDIVEQTAPGFAQGVFCMQSWSYQ